MRKDISRFASNGAVPGLSGLSGYSPGDRKLSLTNPYMKGDDVKFVQGIVGVTVDGIFGPQTSAGVKQFQTNNGLMSTGYVGDATWAKLKDTQSTTGNILSKATRDTLNWITGQTDKLDNPIDKITSGFINPPPSNADGGDKSSGGIKHLGWWLGGGAVAISLLGITLASSGDKK